MDVARSSLERSERLVASSPVGKSSVQNILQSPSLANHKHAHASRSHAPFSIPRSDMLERMGNFNYKTMCWVCAPAIFAGARVFLVGNIIGVFNIQPDCVVRSAVVNFVDNNGLINTKKK